MKNSYISRIIALLILVLSMISPVYAGDSTGPDNIEAGLPNVGCGWSYPDVFTGLTITSSTDFTLLYSGWSDCLVWQTGQFLHSSGQIIYGYYGGDDSSGYRSQLDVDVDLDEEETHFGDYLATGSFTGGADTDATCTSQWGNSQDVESKSMVYTW